MDQELREKIGIRAVGESQRGRSVLIYGDAGRGKTTLLDTLDGPVFLITLDCGEQVLKGKHIDVFDVGSKDAVDEITRVDRFIKIVNFLSKREKLDWKYIVVDNISELNWSLNEALQNKRGIAYPRLLDYRDTGIQIGRYVRKLRNLVYKGADVIIIAWEDTVKVDDFGGEVMSEKMPMVGGKQVKSVCGLMDFVMALRIDKKRNRYLQLDADIKYHAKKREEPGRDYPSEIPCPRGATDTLENFFKMIRGENVKSDDKE